MTSKTASKALEENGNKILGGLNLVAEELKIEMSQPNSALSFLV